MSFVNPKGLEPRGRTCSPRPPHRAAPPRARRGRTAWVRCSRGYVETSNVNVVEELVSMIQTQRAYELNSKAIRPRTRCCRSWPSYDDDASFALAAVSFAIALAGCRVLNAPPPVDVAADFGASAAGRRAGREQRRDLPDRAVPAALRGLPGRLVGDTLTVQIVERVSASQEVNSSVDRTARSTPASRRCLHQGRGAEQGGGRRHLTQRLRGQRAARTPPTTSAA